ncbi:lipoprotein [Longimycelium tulufanense]|uniref:Lipoprotein n=1 Tax=Longimycelium tulufanense TaxID=907463 RepID=A0A8J3FW04_9PSEU|nr:C40 family peptidase [Longimycelium tulufanense]GGM67817.1 lipoprotein [Longimycelium tulufanense]
MRAKLMLALLGPLALMGAILLLAVLAVVTEEHATAAGIAGVACTPGDVPNGVPGLTPTQLGYAATIVQVGKSKGVPVKGLVVAIAAALQESGLHNYANDGSNVPADKVAMIRQSLTYPHDKVGRDHDSVGLFQQRPLAGWGSVQDLMNPRFAAAAFFGGSDKPSAPRGLLDVPNWEGMSVAHAAQAVQVSAFPDAYARHEQRAFQIVGAVDGVTCTGSRGAQRVSLPANPKAETVINAALSQLGVPYAWGGGNAHGPTRGIRDRGVADAHGDYTKVGFDCSGLAGYAYAQIGVTLPRTTQAMWDALQPAITTIADIQPGDLVMLGTPGNVHHVGIYLGDNRIVEAPRSGGVVHVRDNVWAPDSNYATEFIGALRPGV